MKLKDFNKIVEMAEILDHELVVEGAYLIYDNTKIDEIRFDLDTENKSIKFKDFNVCGGRSPSPLGRG